MSSKRDALILDNRRILGKERESGYCFCRSFSDFGRVLRTERGIDSGNPGVKKEDEKKKADRRAPNGLASRDRGVETAI